MSAMEHLWSLLPLPAMIVDATGRVTTLNAAAEVFLGTSETALCGKTVEALFGENTRIVELVARARMPAATASDHAVEFIWPGKQPLSVDLLAASAEDGNDVMLIIQPRSFAEHIDRSLTHRHAARSMSGMAAMMAHEIKNPLAGISGAAQLLEMNAADDDIALTQLIRDETKRIENLINRVEAFGNGMPLRSEPVNIHDVLDRAKRSAELGFARHVRFHEEYDPSLPEVPGDTDQLIQVFMNLLKNAAEATPEVGGVITLRTAYQGGVAMAGPGGARISMPLLIQISDNGVGIPDDLQKEIFEPFVTTKTGGSGLGLSLVSKIIADHGGSIDCVSRPGWTSFRLRLPIWRAARRPIAAVGG
ncbi:MAG: ATP-binding protein [Pseudomonadota bacterium]